MNFGTIVNSPKQSREYSGFSITAGSQWMVWEKPTRASKVHILLLGQGGGGGTGLVGAYNNACGGGGGGSGGQTVIDIPASMIPNRLYISCGGSASGAGIASYVCTRPETTANLCLAFAAGGGVGGNGSTGSGAGAGGTGGAIATNANMPLGFSFATVLAGQAGGAGGITGAQASQLGRPTTGLIIQGGNGGGGNSNGNGYDAVTPAFISSSWSLPSIPGTTSSTVPGPLGTAGIVFRSGTLLFTGGGGGGSNRWDATGAGLVQARGGMGAYGCGSGGMGAALSGSTAATATQGGLGYCLIEAY